MFMDFYASERLLLGSPQKIEIARLLLQFLIAVKVFFRITEKSYGGCVLISFQKAERTVCVWNF